MTFYDENIFTWTKPKTRDHRNTSNAYSKLLVYPLVDKIVANWGRGGLRDTHPHLSYFHAVLGKNWPYHRYALLSLKLVVPTEKSWIWHCKAIPFIPAAHLPIRRGIGTGCFLCANFFQFHGYFLEFWQDIALVSNRNLESTSARYHKVIPVTIPIDICSRHVFCVHTVSMGGGWWALTWRWLDYLILPVWRHLLISHTRCHRL